MTDMQELLVSSNWPVVRRNWVQSRNAELEDLRAMAVRGFNLHLVAQQIICHDGFRLSVQASYGHYCSPREWVNDGAYGKWEVMLYGDDPEFHERCDGEGSPDNEPYGWVATEIIEDLIKRHGGWEKDEPDPDWLETQKPPTVPDMSKIVRKIDL